MFLCATLRLICSSQGGSWKDPDLIKAECWCTKRSTYHTNHIFPITIPQRGWLTLSSQEDTSFILGCYLKPSGWSVWTASYQKHRDSHFLGSSESIVSWIPFIRTYPTRFFVQFSIRFSPPSQKKMGGTLLGPRKTRDKALLGNVGRPSHRPEKRSMSTLIPNLSTQLM